MTIRVLVNGARGRMGSETVKAVQADPECELVAQLDHGDDLAGELARLKPDVAVDFTVPEVAYANAQAIVRAGVRPVVGTTGFTPQQIEALQEACAKQGLGGLIAPNFAIGAVLMMRFAAEAARYLPHVEIIELHHDQKVEAPSGTAIKTAQMIEKARPTPPAAKVAEVELSPGARGAKGWAVPIHSVRLPGHVAHQEVIFGAPGERLSIRHDSIHRESFMPGVVLSCKKVMALDRMVYGLENLL